MELYQKCIIIFMGNALFSLCLAIIFFIFFANDPLFQFQEFLADLG
ncbi:MAG: hypothetical protein HWN67_08525 [Candidatus Helarchaeota archaeon]|nr:hypothetical protein [Candidatus Helarchaeota archaeon]